MSKRKVPDSAPLEQSPLRMKVESNEGWTVPSVGLIVVTALCVFLGIRAAFHWAFDSEPPTFSQQLAAERGHPIGTYVYVGGESSYVSVGDKTLIVYSLCVVFHHNGADKDCWLVVPKQELNGGIEDLMKAPTVTDVQTTADSSSSTWCSYGVPTITGSGAATSYTTR